MAKCILTIDLFEATPGLNNQTDKESKTVKSKDRCKAITLGPVAFFTITQNHKAGFGPKGHKLFILLDG